MRNEHGEVRVAGGVVLRRDGETVLVLMIHRPDIRDWSLPKGKVKKGEKDADAALREVEEETGLRCELGSEAGTMRYLDSKARAKAARLWLMTPRSGRFHASTEVDACEWLDLRTAIDRATRSGERDFLATLAARLSWHDGDPSVSAVVNIHEEE